MVNCAINIYFPWLVHVWYSVGKMILGPLQIDGKTKDIRN